MFGIGISRKDRRDYGVEGKFGRDDGIEEPYWGPYITDTRRYQKVEDY